MRDDKEKKTITKSLVLSKKQLQTIMEEAEKEGKNFSEFMVDRALHGNCNINPEIAITVQGIVNNVLGIYSHIDIAGMRAKENFEQKTIDLLGKLEGLSQAEKIDILHEDIVALKNGGKKLWELLK